LAALLALLLIFPIAMRYWSKRHRRAASWTLTGAAFGSVVSPISMGLYATYFLGPVLGPIFLVTGLIGLALTLFHGTPGFNLCLLLGLIKQRTVVSGSGQILVEAVNGLFWALVYGGFGAVFDWRLARRSNNRL
jgi:hypothetical protein